MAKNEKKIVFSEEIDSKISGFACVLAFLSVGIFLLLFPNYLGNKLAAAIIRWIFIVIGILGLMVEFPKMKSSNIKGFDNFIQGVIVIGVWAVLFVYLNIWWINIISFFLFLIGLYVLYQGLIEVIYSLINNVKNRKQTKKSATTDIMLLFTKVAGLVLVILQLIKALGT